MNVVLLPGFCLNWVLLISCFTSCLAFSHRRGYNWSGTSEVCFCFVSDLNTTNQVPMRYIFCLFWGGYIRDYQWGASFISNVDTEDATGEVHFLVSDLDTTDQKPWSVFFVCVCFVCFWLGYNRSITMGSFCCCCLEYNRCVPNEVHFLLFWLGYNTCYQWGTFFLLLTWIQLICTNDVHVVVSDLDTTDLLPMRYIFCCFWLGCNRSITNEVPFLLLFLPWIQWICYQWGTFFAVSDLDTTNLLPVG